MINKVHAQKHQKAIMDEYNFIMRTVQDRIYVNYDSMMYLFNNYAEYAYIDSSKKLLNAVQIISLRRESSMSVFSSLPDRSSFTNFFISGTIAGNKKNIGFSGLGEWFLGSTSYSSPETNRITQYGTSIVQFPTSQLRHSANSKPQCAISPAALLKKTEVEVEVKDTIYNNTDCFLLRATYKFTFVYENDPELTREKNKKRRESAGNWDVVYQKNVVVDIINKKDYAILYFSSNDIWTNNHNEYRFSSQVNKYKKVVNYYYLEHYERIFPRIVLESFTSGLNSQDLYTLIVSQSSDAAINKHMEQERKINNMKRITSSQKYEDYLEKKDEVNHEITKIWDSYWNQIIN